MAQKTPILFRQLTQDQHLIAYSQFTKKYLDVTYPLEYLKRSKVIALVKENQRGEIQTICGGYILALQGPFRVLEQLPIGIAENNLELQDKMAKCFELTGLWIHPIIKNGSLRALFWLRLFAELLKQTAKGKTHALYSYDSSKKKLGEIYSISKPCRIFEGEVFIPGMTTSAFEIVEMGSIPAVVKAFYREPQCIVRFLTKRMMRNRRLKKKEQTAPASELRVSRSI